MPEQQTDDREYRSATPMPAYVAQEDPLFVWQGFHASLRQMTTVLVGGLSWWMISQLTSWILPISMLFCMVLWIWLLIAALLLAFGKKQGMSLERYLGYWLTYKLMPQSYVPKGTQLDEQMQAEDASFRFIDDEDDD
jgi:hypothetical protein